MEADKRINGNGIWLRLVLIFYFSPKKKPEGVT